MEASAEEREVRGLISMTTIRPLIPDHGRTVQLAAADYFDGYPEQCGMRNPGDDPELLRIMVSIGAEQKESPVCDAHWVNVFNEADGDHVVFGVAYDFKLEFFPAGDAILQRGPDQRGWPGDRVRRRF